MRTNSSNVTEVASIRTNLDAYSEGYDRIFGKKCDCDKYEQQVCDVCQKITGSEKDKDNE